MEPPIDMLAAFETATITTAAAGVSGSGGGGSGMPIQSLTTTTRYAVRQALDQEYHKYIQRKNAESRREKYRQLNPGLDILAVTSSIKDDGYPDAEKLPGDSKAPRKRDDAVKRDFFGRIITTDQSSAGLQQRPGSSAGGGGGGAFMSKKEEKVWVSFHEGYSNAVRKPITLEELMRGFSHDESR